MLRAFSPFFKGIGTMKLMLELMLLGLAILLRRNAQQPLVQAKLRDRARIVQIRTRDASVARYFVFCGGAVLSRRGTLASPDVSLVWKDAATATRVLRSADPDAVPAALAHEWLHIAGDGEVAAWFGDLVASGARPIPGCGGGKTVRGGYRSWPHGFRDRS
jgi:hypothetical protein